MLSNVTLQDLVDWTQAQLIGPKPVQTQITSITSDTRELKTGDVFIALRGENFDGHHFVDQAIQKGAVAVISEVEPAVEWQTKIPTLKVSDTLRAYVAIGRSLRFRFKGKVLAITGSAGKSSTKDMARELLGSNTIASPKSFNNLLGVSKTLCLLEDQTLNLVLEMGMNNLGEIQEMCEAFEPQGAVITNIGDAHIGKLGGREGIYKAKKELFDWISRVPNPLGIALNLDDEWIVRAWKDSFREKQVKTVTFSATHSQADIFISKKNVDSKSGCLSVHLMSEGDELEVNLPHFGMHHAYNLAAAVSLAKLVGVSWVEIKERLKKIVPSKSRGEFIALKNGVTLIDESYNSNPSALMSSLESLFYLEPGKRKILVLGEMRELDQFSSRLHGEVGEKLGKIIEQNKQSVVLFTVGKEAQEIVNGVRKISPLIPAQSVSCVEEVIPLVQEQLQTGDVLFVKGSRGIGLDKLVQQLS